jgi:acylphosphatase
MKENLQEKAIRLQIYGRVQGVGFRYYAQKEAQMQGLRGFVKNRPDGSVYIEAEGSTDQLEAFILWCETGPAWARVSKVEKQWIPLQGHQGFAIQ